MARPKRIPRPAEERREVLSRFQTPEKIDAALVETQDEKGSRTYLDLNQSRLLPDGRTDSQRLVASVTTLEHIISQAKRHLKEIQLTFEPGDDRSAHTVLREFKTPHVDAALIGRHTEQGPEVYLGFNRSRILPDGTTRVQSFSCYIDPLERIVNRSKHDLEQIQKTREKELASRSVPPRQEERTRQEEQTHPAPTKAQQQRGTRWAAVSVEKLTAQGLKTKVEHVFDTFDETELYATRRANHFAWHEALNDPKVGDTLYAQPGPNENLDRERRRIEWKQETQGIRSSFGVWYDRDSLPSVGQTVRIENVLEYRGEPADERIRPRHDVLNEGDRQGKPLYVVVEHHPIRVGLGTVRFTSEDRAQSANALSTLSEKLRPVELAKDSFSPSLRQQHAQVDEVVSERVSGRHHGRIVDRLTPTGERERRILFTEKGVRELDGTTRDHHVDLSVEAFHAFAKLFRESEAKKETHVAKPEPEVKSKTQEAQTKGPEAKKEPQTLREEWATQETADIYFQEPAPKLSTREMKARIFPQFDEWVRNKYAFEEHYFEPDRDFTGYIAKHAETFIDKNEGLWKDTNFGRERLLDLLVQQSSRSRETYLDTTRHLAPKSSHVIEAQEFELEP